MADEFDIEQYLIDNHIGIFKNFMPNKMIDDYINYFNT